MKKDINPALLLGGFNLDFGEIDFNKMLQPHFMLKMLKKIKLCHLDEIEVTVMLNT